MLALMGSRVIRELDAWTDFMGWIGSSSFGAGRHLDAASRRAFRKGSAAGARAAFHYYMRSALHSAALYRGIHAALTGPLATMPVLTIFGEHNDPFGFQRRWKALFPHASQVVVPGGHHFPMCDDPELVSDAIRSWYVAAVRRPLSVAAGER
jgi:pimeloyl-ACP methyl ester carboxylesterase